MTSERQSTNDGIGALAFRTVLSVGGTCACVIGGIIVGGIWGLLLFGAAGLLLAKPWRRCLLNKTPEATAEFSSAPSLLVAAVFACVYPIMCLDNPYLMHIGALAWIYVVFALGLNVTLGFVGQLDLGYAAYAAVGAYSSALLALRFGFPFWLSLPSGAFFAACLGALVSLPASRVAGHYLALVTLGFGQVVYLLAKNLRWITGGPNGLTSIPSPCVLGWDLVEPLQLGSHKLPFQMNFYFLCLTLAGITYAFCRRIRLSRTGRVWASVRDDETAALTFGINVAAEKTKAFALSAFFGGLGGATYAHMIGFIEPGDFTFVKSVVIVCMVILGGRGSMSRVVVAAILLCVLPERLRVLGEYRLLAFGVAVLLLALMSPRAVTSVETRKVRTV